MKIEKKKIIPSYHSLKLNLTEVCKVKYSESSKVKKNFVIALEIMKFDQQRRKV